jgi:cytochrome c biogenesis factor
MNSVSGLALMVTATWLLMLAETYVLFGVIRPLAPNIHESATSAVLKVGATVVLVLVWVGVMFVLRSFYVTRVARSSSGPAAAPPGDETVEPQK